MRWFRRALLASPIFLFVALAARAEIPSWLQWLPASSAAANILYRAVPALGGSIPVRRPPRETAVHAGVESAKRPMDAELVTLTAREYEAQLDFVNAEDRWKLLTAISADRAGSQIALADYYHRRMQPQQELQALAAAGGRLPAIEDPLQPETQQRA